MSENKIEPLVEDWDMVEAVHEIIEKINEIIEVVNDMWKNDG